MPLPLLLRCKFAALLFGLISCDDTIYETVGGFLTFMLRRIPHRTDFVVYAGYKFEIMDIDNYKIDQILVTRLAPQEPKQDESSEARERD